MDTTPHGADDSQQRKHIDREFHPVNRVIRGDWQ
jgi:hypothetical protein